MKNNIDNMVNGWFVGNFKPTVLSTNDVEVAVKRYKENDYEEKHFHKIATEITMVVEGKIEMDGSIYQSGDIITINPFTATDFRALTNVITVVVKHPGANNDKYLGEPDD
ncbi:hypothetical protein N9400_02605 [Candidatus Thioglobus sp.]|nr:hypothetical protein [Candidatus Thioglobus sp.]